MHSSAFDPHRYPRSYRPSLVFRVAVTFFGGVLCLSGACALLGATQDRTSHGMPLPFMIPALMMLSGLLLVSFALRFRIVLAATFIERRLLRTCRIERSNITTCRRAVVRNPPSRIVVYFLQAEGRRRPFAITCALTEEDVDFKKWFAGLPELRPGSR